MKYKIKEEDSSGRIPRNKSISIRWREGLIFLSTMTSILLLNSMLAPVSATFGLSRPPPPPPPPPRHSNQRDESPPHYEPHNERDIPPRLSPHKIIEGKGTSSLSPRRDMSPSSHHPINKNTHHHRGKLLRDLGDLHPAAQTLYDLRGFNIPLGGQQETQRFLRQQQHDPFSRPSGFHPPQAPPHQNNRNEPRTAPLVFPSFYQQQNPTGESQKPQQILNIFGHSQHLSQTKYEPAGQSDGPGFRPSQVDVGYDGPSRGQKPPAPPQPPPPPPPRPPPVPQHFPPQHQNHQNQQIDLRRPQDNHNNQNNHNQDNHIRNELQGRQVGQQILNYRAPQLNQGHNQGHNQNHQNQNHQNHNEDPFIYVYDDEDYDEGEDDFSDKPQQEINHNRVTSPRPIPTAAPLRSQAPTFRSTTQAPTRETTAQPKPTAKALIQSTSTPFPLSHNNNQQNDFYSQINSAPHQNNNNNNNFFFNNNNNNNDHFNQNPSPHVTPRPNVEIVPSSERKPPPDQSNAIIPVLQETRGSSGQRSTPNNAKDDRFRRPTTSTEQSNKNKNNFGPQTQTTQEAQRVRESSRTEEQYREPPTQKQQQKENNNLFNQVVNLDEEDDSYIENEGEINEKLNPFNWNKFQEPPSRLRPVNTIVPKNRVPQGDIILPHNYPFHEDINDITTTITPSLRTDLLRTRPPTTPEVTQSYQRGSRPQQSNNPTQVPTRTRGSVTRTHGTTESTSEVPKRVRTRLRPQHRVTSPQITTTTSTTTTPLPTKRTTTIRLTSRFPPPLVYEDEISDEEYYEDYNNSNKNKNNIRVVDSYEQVEQEKPYKNNNKSPLRPVFTNNNQIQELNSPKSPPVVEEGPRRLRPGPTPTPIPIITSTAYSRARVNSNPNSNSNAKRLRENNNGAIESPRTRTVITTGKPLYYAGKMLSKEGGLYAGQTIGLDHIYGKPVPHMPINYVFEKIPSALLHSTQRPKNNNKNNNNANAQQNKSQRVRVNTRDEDNSAHPHKSAQQNHNHRLVHPSRAKPLLSHAPDSVETTREGTRGNQLPKKFARPQAVTTAEPLQNQNQGQNEGQPPRRRKIRPGQKQRPAQGQNSQINAKGEGTREREVVSISVTEEEEPSTIAPRVQRPNRIRPQVIQVTQTPQEEEETPSTSPPPPKLRPRRIRPNQKAFVPQPQAESPDEEEESAKPPRKLRPRARPGRLPLQHSTAQPEFSESVSINTQSSVKINRKPTEAAGRFSSRFRDEPPAPTTIVTSTQSSTSDSDENHKFSPTSNFKPKATFKPQKPLRLTSPNSNGGNAKPKRIRPQQKQQQEPSDAEDDLPPSIRLSAKDVVLNRKPARRIPPGSASDRLKALQERRKKNKEKQTRLRGDEEQEEQNNNEDEIDENNRPQPNERTLRRRKLLQQRLRKQKERQEQQIEEEPEEFDHLEQQQSEYQNKREITHKTLHKPQNDVNVPEEEYPAEYPNEEYDALEKELKNQVERRKLQIPASRASGRKNSEVTSDEARSVLGIQRPSISTSTLTSRSTKGQQEQEEENNYYADEEDYEAHQSEQNSATELPPAPLSSSTFVTTTSTTTESSNIKSISPISPGKLLATTLRSVNKKLLPKVTNKNIKLLGSSVTTSTSTSSSVSSTHHDQPQEIEEDDQVDVKSSAKISSTTASSLKARLRPNKKLLSSIQPRISQTQQRQKNESTRHSNLSKLLKFKTSSSTYSPIGSSSSDDENIFKMSTDDPSLPLAKLFTSSKSQSSSSTTSKSSS